MRRFAVSGLAALVLACSSSGDSGRGAAFRPLVVGDSAPRYAAATLTGDTVRVGAGQPVLLNVWATWCVSCKEEMADLAAIERQYALHGVRVLAVSVDGGDGGKVRRFVESQGMKFAVAHDPDGSVQRQFQAVGVPETYLVAGDGRLLWVRRGGLHDAEPGVLAGLDSAMRSLSPGR
jgi:thiol-disulfide isomerase/thioredoxin